MGKTTYQLHPKVREIHDDLEKFLAFCREYGYRYNEADLYNWKSYAYQQFNKLQNGKPAKNMWDQDIPR